MREVQDKNLIRQYCIISKKTSWLIGECMKKIVKPFLLTFLLILLLDNLVYSQVQDLTKITDNFYAGLADIIEVNMDNPDKCLREVEDYYQKNEAIIKQIRILTEKAMKQLTPLVDEYMSMSEAELEAFAREQKLNRQSHLRMSPGAVRYTETMKDFAMKYPAYGLQVATKALQLIPGGEQLLTDTP